jgi:A/G-specific adenine glycosylase
MDLGAGVCLARQPRCDACPVAASARRGWAAGPRPTRSRRASSSAAHASTSGCSVPGEQVFSAQRPDQGVWARLWSLPEFDSVEQALAALDSLPGDPVEQPPIVHALTHFDWTLAPLQWSLPARLPRGLAATLAERWPQGRWVQDRGAVDGHSGAAAPTAERGRVNHGPRS